MLWIKVTVKKKSCLALQTMQNKTTVALSSVARKLKFVSVRNALLKEVQKWELGKPEGAAFPYK